MFLKHSRRHHAFTLGEVLVALGLIAVAILSVLALSISVARTSQEGVDQSVGGLVATQLLDSMIDKLRADPPPGGLRKKFLDNDDSSKSFDSGTIVNNGTEYAYEIFATTVRKTDGSPLGEAVGRRLKKVDVVVSWWDTKDTQRQGYGKLQFFQSRLVGEAEL
jgi:type II secretory pathway pseudopilin PulG